MAEEQTVMEDESVEVEIDAPEGESEQVEVSAESEQKSDEELENYSSNVQKRIYSRCSGAYE